jgi:dipeptidase E
MRALLISNSGRPFLEHCRAAIAEFLGPRRRIAFITAASYEDEATYHDIAQRALEPVGLEVLHVYLEKRPLQVLDQAQAVFVGGGNTFHLLGRLHATGLLDALGTRVLGGMPYIGSSAGANVAGPNILTTNDWNVDGISRFDALGLVPFNINPHYRETDPAMAPFSETRDERIGQYLQVHENPVLGIEEQTLVCWEKEAATVLGHGRVRRFRRGVPPCDFRPGERIEL